MSSGLNRNHIGDLKCFCVRKCCGKCKFYDIIFSK